MRSKALRYTTHFFIYAIALFSLRFPLAYLGLIDLDIPVPAGSPFAELGQHFLAFIKSHDLAFLAHVLGAIVALATGPFQFNAALRARNPRLHRQLGYFYFSGILIGGIAGLMIAPNAWGGPITHYGFSGLAIAWLLSSARGLRLATQGRIAEHHQIMKLSYALTLAAVSLRVQMPLLLIAGMSDLHVYQTVAWSCWLPQLLWWVKKDGKGNNLSQHPFFGSQKMGI